MKAYEDLLYRGLIKDISNSDLVKKHLNDNKIRFYCGFDPTGNSLTVGHLVQIVRMKLLENYGHTPVAIIGGGTGLIGDPREVGERKLLKLEESLSNAKLIQKQIERFLNKDKTLFINNYEWLSKIDLISFLRDYGKHFNLNYMLAKDTVQSRLETGISFTEFSYMILQSIDFLHLYENYNVKMQFGGSDQWGNITSGLELIRKIKGENDAVGLSSPLLLKSDGQKFGKSEHGAIWLDKDLTSPYELYQYFLNTSDGDVETYLKTLTLLSKDEIENLLKLSQEQPEKREAQKRLAEEVLLFVHGKNDLEDALIVTDALFNNSFDNLNEQQVKMIFNSIDGIKLDESSNIIEALTKSSLASSNRESREFIKNGAVSVNGFKVVDHTFLLTKEKALFNKYFIIKRGRRLYQVVEV